MDLRYNQGGLVTCAQLMTSLLAPADALGKTFCIMEHNEKQSKSDETLLLRKNSEIGNANLDLKRIYVLTGSVTASASEAVINCLIPYLTRSNITIIGEKRLASGWAATLSEPKKNMAGCCIRLHYAFIMPITKLTMQMVLNRM